MRRCDSQSAYHGSAVIILPLCPKPALGGCLGAGPFVGLLGAVFGPFRGQFWAESTRGPFVGLLGVIFGPFRGQFWAESTRGPFVGLLGAIFGPFRGQFWAESTRGPFVGLLGAIFGPFRVHFWAKKRSSPSQVLAGTALRVSFESGTCWPGSCPPWRPLPPRPGCPGTAPRLWTWK